MQIHVKPMTSRYVCLSYVWGTPSKSVQQGPDLLCDAPKVIHDAAFVTRSVGVQYLWVDRYCINQNDPAAKHDAIANMGAIYQGACLTIIAASGDGPHEGLPGVRGTLRLPLYADLYTISQHLQSTEYEGRFRTLLEPASEIISSSWNTRGWTFQEMLLSRRRLVFTPTQMYFQCRCSALHEFLAQEVYDDTLQKMVPYMYRGLDSPGAFPAHDAGGFRDFANFNDRIEEYFPKFLSFPTDYLNAVMGIYEQFAQHQDYPVKELFGVPCHRNREVTGARTLANGLGWILSGNKTWSRPQGADIPYPSWSWAFAKMAQEVNSRGELKFPGSDLTDPTSAWDAKFEVQLFQLSGQSLEMSEFLDGAWSNRDLSPEIVVTAWATCVSEAQQHLFSRGLNEKHSIYLDYPQNLMKVDTTAIYLGFHCFPTPQVFASFLLVQETSNGSYQRIGILRHYTHDSWQHARSVDINELLGALRPTETWQRRSLRLV
ncbi:hypothetical protein NX059_011900 [Plenodomus lindquistii]|nr:hypothetical protein NX059_011900 [Plenodomus lindquistii]